MTNASRLSAGPSANPTALANEWIILNSGCEDLMTNEEWRERRAAAVAYCDTWSEDERTEFFYAVADMACTVPALLPTPGLHLTPETMAHELRRLDRIVYALDGGHLECASVDWLAFTDPLMGGMTVGEVWRYAHERTALAYGSGGRPGVLPADADVKLSDLCG